MNEYSIEQLKNLILKYIEFWYEAKYEGLLEVEKTPNVSSSELNTFYKFTIGLPSYMSPTTISIDCATDDEFLNYIYSELRSRNYMRLDIYKTIRTNDSREE
jgi:hypothetical protein